MARIDFDDIIQKDSFSTRSTVASPVKADYTIATYDGEKFLRIQMYGSRSRQNVGRVSQTLHLNKSDAEEMIKLLKNAFDIS